ncbi:MAG: VWA domain-containing protein, partial [Candidatus Brocadiaceae bacterium]|nr:VWA domain-containing protein [Candidatus Brocadiaceae bacterium]
MIKTYVGDFGGGFVMLGGENSFAQGGYSDTPIEDILPVKVTAGSTFKEKKPRRVSVILLIDKSGSMTGRKLFATKKASIELLKQLKEGDTMGIIAFDVIPYVIAEMEPVTELEKNILSKLGKLNAGGGTDIFPAMKEAYKRLAASGSKINHAILLSDGNTRSIYYSYEALMDQFKQSQISVSTIAVGGWLVNTRLMKDIADRTGGEFYRLKDIDELPKVVVTDADNILTKADFHEESFIPRVDPTSELLKGIDQEQVPPLQGYSLARAKARAEVPLVSDIRGTNDPILANWRYGLGKVVAYTSDAEARWSSQWINWAKYNKFWSQTTRWAMRDKPKGDYTVNVEARDNKTYLVVESSGGEEKDSQLRLRLFSSNFEANDLSLRQVAPRRYVASLEGYKPGTYTLDVSMLKDNSIIDHVTKAVVVPPSSTVAPPEGLSQGNNTELLETLAQRTRGEVNPTLENLTINIEEIMKRED